MSEIFGASLEVLIAAAGRGSKNWLGRTSRRGSGTDFERISSTLKAEGSRRGSSLEPRGSRFEAFWPSGAPLVAAAEPGSESRCVWTPGWGPGTDLERVWAGVVSPPLSQLALLRKCPAVAIKYGTEEA